MGGSGLVDEITSSFFQEVSSSIGYQDKSKKGKKLASTLRKYGRFLNTGESLVTGFSAAVPTLFVIVAALGIWSSFSDTVWVKQTIKAILGVTLGWAVILKWGRTILNKLAGNAETTAKENELSLNQLRQELIKLLSDRDRPLLVIMDDLDRLTSDQLRMVFQLIKANTEFPNVVFLLLFQRSLVEEKLDNGKQTGRDYLEKIIQVPFDIPKIETTRLHNLLFKNIDRIIEQDKTAVKMFDANYWGNVFYSSLHKYFDNLRNVYRFSSTFSFHFSLLKGESVFEVNPIDLIAVECLRLFEPEVYKEIAGYKDLFTQTGSDSYTFDKDEQKEILESIISKSKEGRNEQVKQLIIQLFPTIEWAFTGTNYHSDYSATWLKELRVCYPLNFDRYFQFTISKSELSNSELQEMKKLTADRENLARFILKLQDKGILKNSLSQFEAYVDEIPFDNAEPFIKALLDIGDIVDHEAIGFSMFSSHTHLVRLVIFFLRRC